MKINVKEFGAIGDAVTLNTKAIQKAINLRKNNTKLYHPKQPQALFLQS